MAGWVPSVVSSVASIVGSAVSVISGCTMSVVVEKIIDTGFSFIRDRIIPDDGESELERLHIALPLIKSLMGIAEALREKDPSCNGWFHQFRRAVNASEDVLDELEYKKLEDMVKKRDEASGSSSRSNKQKSCSISKDTLMRLREAITMLDQATADVECLHQRAMELGVHDLSKSLQEANKVLRRETTSFLVETEVFGRDVEKEKIINWLKQPTEGHISPFGIVGMGGLGKTTLAQLAYQEMRGSIHFDQTIWVCVSTEFSVEGLTRKILGEIGDNSCGSDKPLNALQETLKEKIISKKILLVLDDVWDDENRSSWEQLIAPLRFAKEGSKLLFTTRMKSVSNLITSVINTKHEPLILEGMGEQQMRLLFNNYAFRGSNPESHSELQAIGDQIVKMLKGSPLAAKVIGSLVNSQLNYEYWGRILKCGSLFNVDQAKNVVDILKLSYYHLPTDLQVCFRFCSIFPQDYLFDKKELIEMWIACGFIRPRSSQTERSENIGEDYFNQLLWKSFFELSQNNSNGQRYVMHDLIYDLAQIVSAGECCRIAPNNTIIPNTVQHVSVHESEIGRISHLEDLHSLIITTSWKRFSLDPDSFVLPYNLIKRTLRLIIINGNRTCKLPEISCLLHLRYLSVRLGYMAQPFKYLLPTSIYKLYHLQVLEFSSYPQIVGSSYSGIEATGLTNLVSLRHMRLPNEIVKTIPGVHKLTSLEELTFFVGHESGYLINELGTLKNLRRLCIENIENIGDPAEAKCANLMGMGHLISLCLKWTSQNKSDNPEQIMDCLQPHPKLRELTIENFRGQRSPSWMEDASLLELSSLKLFNCPVWRNQLFSWQMPILTILEIRHCPNLDKLPNMPISLVEFRLVNVGLTSLPYMEKSFGATTPQPLSIKSSLRSVEIRRCANLVSLNGFFLQDNVDFKEVENIGIYFCEILAQLAMDSFGKFVSLKYLQIEDCPNLTELPNLPLSLINFTIDNMGLSSLPEYYPISGSNSNSSASSLRKVNILGCQNLTSLNGFMQQDSIDFQFLENIRIHNCKNLVHLPLSALWKFVSLTDLEIINCPMLAAVDNQSNLLPMALKVLSIENCGELDALLLESASCLTALTELRIGNCTNITHIPCSENAFGSLSKLFISRCDKLVEQSSTEQALVNLQGSSLASLNIDHLYIDHLSLLLIEPLSSLRFVSTLYVSYCSGMEALPEQWLLQNSCTLRELRIKDARTLKSLPATMASLTSLEELKIYNADFLEELPKLPPLLKEKRVQGLGGRYL